VRRALLQNPALCPVDDQGNINIDLLYHLAEEFPNETAEAPAFVLHAFYGDPTPMIDVIKNILSYSKNPKLIGSILFNFAHLNKYIESRAASNRFTPQYILRDLSQYNQALVASNPNSPPDVLRTL